MVRKFSIAFSILAIVFASVLPAGAATHTVEIPGRFFQPSRLNVFVDDTVRWVNGDNQRHSVSANTSAQAQGEFFDSSSRCPGGLLGNNCMRPGESFSHTFTQPGTYTYRCKLHGSDTSFAACDMCGQIIVRERTAPPPTQPPPTPPTTKSPSTSMSPSTTPSVSATATASSPLAGGSPPSEGPFPVMPVAGAALILLAASAFLVYRNYLKS